MDTEPKTKVSLYDAVKAYHQQQDANKKYQAKRNAETKAELLAKLDEIGMQPLRVEEANIAIFEYEVIGEIKFRVFEIDGYWSIRRIGACPNCGKEIESGRANLDILDIGALIVNPYWETHNHFCPGEYRGETAEQRLVSALRELLDTGGES